jgi:serine/threonine-protein kinase HipA
VSQAVEVRIWGMTVGAVAQDPASNFHAFEYSNSWLKRGIELSPLFMSTSQAREPFIFPDLSRQTYSGLPGMLADALPDRWGNRLVDAYLQGINRTRESITPLDRLSYMGRRGLGALEFKPATGTRSDSRAALDMQRLVEEARTALQGKLNAGPEAAQTLSDLIRVGTSAGGARAKAVIAWNKATGEIRSGQFEVPPGFEHWLLKLDGLHDTQVLGDTLNFGRLEYAYHLMATAAGIQMAPCRLHEEGGRAHFMTRRFDREQNEKIHVQTLCGLAHLDFNQANTHDYAQAFQVIAKLGMGPDATDELFRRMAFNVMAMNRDDHTKNLSFMLRRGGTWELAPAYDITFSYNPESRWVAKHQMAINRKFEDITRQDFMEVADRYSVRRPKDILAQVAEAVGGFNHHAFQAGLPRREAEEVARLLRPI